MDLDPSIVWDFAGEVVGTLRPASRAVPATVTRIDADGTVGATVGDGMEAPAASSSVGLSVGDEVSVEWSGARMSVTGNVSDPSAGVRADGDVRHVAQAARELAKDAKAVAEGTGQDFWHDRNGAHVSTEQGNPTAAQNSVWNSLGMLFRRGANNVLAIVTGTDAGMDVYDGEGNADENTVASFRGSGARVGRLGAYNAVLTSAGMVVRKALESVVTISARVDAAGRRIGTMEIGSDGGASVTGTSEDSTSGGVTTHRRESDLRAYAPDASDIAIVGAWSESASDGTSEGGVRLYGEFINLEYGTTYGSVPMVDAAKAVAAQSGTVAPSSTGVAAGSASDLRSVTFPTTYDSVPNVVVGFSSTTSAGGFGRCSVAVNSISATGFTYRIFNGDTTARNPGIYWIAL